MIKNVTKFRLIFLGVVLLLIYSYSPYKIEFMGSYNKIWAHRTNSSYKLNSALKYFKGVEIDIIYDEHSNTFDVNHPPSKSINLTLSKLLADIQQKERPYLWLDIKNLNYKNAPIIFDKLVILFNRFNFEFDKVLIETRYPKALPIFTKAGFKTSYYLPYRLNKKKDSELKEEINKIDKILKEQPNIGISTNHKDYDIINANFPNKTKYIWALVWPINIDFFITNRILKDPKVKVVLVNYKSLKGNR